MGDEELVKRADISNLKDFKLEQLSNQILLQQIEEVQAKYPNFEIDIIRRAIGVEASVQMRLGAISMLFEAGWSYDIFKREWEQQTYTLLRTIDVGVERIYDIEKISGLDRFSTEEERHAWGESVSTCAREETLVQTVDYGFNLVEKWHADRAAEIEKFRP